MRTTVNDVALTSSKAAEAEASRQRKAGVAITYIYLATNVVVTLFYTPFLLCMLGQSDYGIYSIAYSVITFSLALNYGFGNANVRYTSQTLAKGGDLPRLHGIFFLIYCALAVVVALVGAVILFRLEPLFGQGLTVVELERLRRMLLVAIVTISASFPVLMFRYVISAYERFVFLGVFDFVKALLFPLTSVVLLLLDYKAVALIVAVSVVNMSMPLLNVWYCRRKLGMRISFNKLDTRLLGEILRYSAYIYLASLAYELNNISNQFILGSVAGSVQVAVYALAFNLFLNFRLLSNCINSVFLPAVSKVPDDADKLRHYNGYFVAVGRVQFYIVALFVAGFVFFGQGFIALWAGPDYATSFWVVLVLICGSLVQNTQTVGVSILQAQFRHRFYSVMAAVLAISNLVLSAFLSARYGAVGAACSLAALWLLGNGLVLNIYYSRRIGLDVKYFWAQIARAVPPMLPAVAFGALYCHFIAIDSWLRLVVGAGGFAVLYGLGITMFAFNDFEKESLLTPALRMASRVPVAGKVARWWLGRIDKR